MPAKLPASAAGLERRARALEGAVTAFARSGYAGASLREVAAEAEMEKGHLTYYFSSKEDLLFEIVDDLHERFLRTIGGEPGDEGLLRVFRSHLHLILQRTEQVRVAYDSFRFLSPERRAAIVAKRDAYERALADLIDRSRPLTAVADAPTPLIAKAVLAQLNWPYQWYAPDGPLPADDLVAVLAERALATLR